MVTHYSKSDLLLDVGIIVTLSKLPRSEYAEILLVLPLLKKETSSIYLTATDVVTSDVTKVTGRSLVSMILVEAIEELRNFEVILLTEPAFTPMLSFLVDNMVEVAT